MRPTKEIWKDIADYEGLYSVSNLGRVKSLPRVIQTSRGTRKLSGKILKTEICKSTGYVFVNLHKNGKPKHCTVHRLVANAFIPNPHNLPIVNHGDENRQNNHADNLEWTTNKDNLQYSDAWNKGVKCRRSYDGENNPFYGKHHTKENKHKCGTATRGKVYVNDGIKEIAIEPSKLQEYLAQGYKRGYVRHGKTS